ncbi:N-acetylmuramoyl-L-alanine amidase CwlD [Pontibacillus salipaludis]|uniref:Germination-specific N-acetylmuramoyl-L-alanine amidase n=1 Tax=Pontibacillus salipaludis TaxID=1697394 RepID=A0ABQ1QGQ4_9BACI|nr:N-acetylmuramoyl-L-alanine amidase CwlD [Pontibacillus salipaludis]GGD26597.1 germination-specific N-acetylmuramoyl-L-alanine amidase [Pontibacillus salipaludis]
MGKAFKISSWFIGLVVLIVLIRYPIETNDSWQTWSLPLAGKVIVIDPGHGGVDGGAVGSDETLEKEITLEVSKKLRDYLQQAGALVYMTRERDVDLADEDEKSISKRKSQDLKRRVEFINDKEADFYVSVHLNAIPSPKWHGAQSFYNASSPESEQLAKLIQSEIKRNLENTNRSALAISNMYLLRSTESPGALVEIGFLSNAHERELLKTEEYQNKVAASVYEGMLRYVTEDAIPE